MADLISNIARLEEHQKTLGDKLAEQQKVAAQLRTESAERMSQNLGGAGLNSSYINTLAGLQKSSFGAGPLMQAHQQVSTDLNQAYRQREELQAQEKARAEQAEWERERFDREMGFKEKTFADDRDRWEREYGLKLSQAEAALIGTPDAEKERILKAKKLQQETGGTTIEQDVEYAKKFGVDLRRDIDGQAIQYLTDLDAVVDEVLNNPLAIRGLYGWFRTKEGKEPSKLKELFTANTQANVGRLVNMLTMEGREDLKGAGQITDYEMHMLKDSLTVLDSKSITPSEVKAELKRLKENIKNSEGKILEYRSLIPEIYGEVGQPAQSAKQNVWTMPSVDDYLNMF